MAQKVTSIEPWADIVILSKPPEDVTEQGVILSSNAEDDKRRKPEKGIIVSIGMASKEYKELEKLLSKLKPGDMLYYERYTANEIPDAGQEYNFVRFRNIMGFKKL